MTLRIQPFPLCCGIAVVTGFGNDPRHAHRDRRDGAPTMAEIEQYLTNAAAGGLTGGGPFQGTGLGRVGMLLAAVNAEQRVFMQPIFRRLGWRRAGRAHNIHNHPNSRPGDDNYSEIFLYRKVLANAQDDD